MTDSLFFIFVVISVFSYGLQMPFNVLFARKFDPLILAVYRNLSLVITMLPLLLFVPKAEIWAIADHTVVLLFASASGAFAFVCSLTAARYLPVGISSSIRQAVYVSGAVVFGAAFFGDYLSPLQLVILAGIVGSATVLTLTKTVHPHLDPTMAWKGALFAVCAGLGHALTFYLFSVLSRELHPFVASYFWEVFIGIFALLYLLILLALGKHRGALLLPARETVQIALISLLTISGTVGYSFAVNHGPLALASGLITTAVLVATAIGWFLFNERLSKLQIGLILFAVALMFLLKVAS